MFEFVIVGILIDLYCFGTGEQLYSQLFAFLFKKFAKLGRVPG